MLRSWKVKTHDAAYNVLELKKTVEGEFRDVRLLGYVRKVWKMQIPTIVGALWWKGRRFSNNLLAIDHRLLSFRKFVLSRVVGSTLNIGDEGLSGDSGVFHFDILSIILERMIESRWDLDR